MTGQPISRRRALALFGLGAALVFAYLVSIFIVMDDPQGTWSVLASLFPITAPLAMPLRWASGDVPTYQLLLAMALTAGTAVLLVALAGSIYRRALLITGRRIPLREMISHQVAS